MTLPEDLKQLLLAFNAQRVEYLIIGGYAVGVYSEPRATKDLDLFIRSDVRNSEAVYRALAAFGAPLAGMTPADFRNDPYAIFQIGLPPARVDILQHIIGVTFDEAWQQRTEASLDEIATHVISAEHLIQNKLQTGRARDFADVEAIRTITEDEFKKTVKRSEDEILITYDIRPFGHHQQKAVALYLGNLIFRLSVSALNTSKAVVLLVDTRFVSTPQLDGFIVKLKTAGLPIEVRCLLLPDTKG
jgi:hypothetical protein